MTYPIAIHRDRDSDYGVTVPDLPGCFSAGSTIDEALAMAKEAIELHLEGLVEAGQIIPAPKSIDRHRRNSLYRGAAWALVSVDTASVRLRAKRVNITMPQRILDAVDRRAAAESDTRSGLLTKAAAAYITSTRTRAARNRIGAD